MPSVSRYHPLLVALHWLVALTVIGLLAVGFLLLANLPTSDPRVIGILRLHMAGGMFVLVLMAVRLAVRMRTTKPPPAESGNAMLDRLARVVHWAFYLIVLVMVGTGYATGILAGLPAIVFGGSGAPLPEDFDGYATFQVHSNLALLLLALVTLHAVAALYHQFVRKDRLLSRMSFGPRN
jgi:cytochrome b561